MRKAGIQSASTPLVEYTIYTFACPDEGETGALRWARERTLHERDTALGIAQKLAGSGAYERVEIKKKYFDERSNQNKSRAIKIFEPYKKHPLFFLVLLGRGMCRLAKGILNF